MLNKLKKFAEQISNAADVIPHSIDDPIAQKTEWTPLKGGGSSFRTHKLIENHMTKMSYKPTWASFVFAGVFMAIGIGVMCIVLLGLTQETSFIPVIFGFIFFLVGAILFYTMHKPIIFDKQNGYFWKGWKKPDEVMLQRDQKNTVRLSDIYAIQVIREYIRGDKKNYYSYEINLITRDAERHNVIDHGNKKHIMNDADRLGAFLGVPVWKM